MARPQCDTPLVLFHISQSSPPVLLYGLYPWKLNCGQSIWNKTDVLLGTSWGIFEHPLGNLMGTHWKQEKKEEKNPSPPPPTPKVKNNPLNAC
jgi:hypothetical protein